MLVANEKLNENDIQSVFVTGMSIENENNNDTIESITTSIGENIDSKMAENPPLNRAQRRALMHKKGKKGRKQMDLVSETAKKLDYIELIQKLRALNEKKEQEENGETEK